MNIPYSWGINRKERGSEFPCDKLGNDYNPFLSLYRGITIKSEPEIIFKWLCQMRYGSYSYEPLESLQKFGFYGYGLIESFRERVPQSLLPDQAALETGQSMMIFDVVCFETNRHITLSIKPGSNYPVKTLDVSYVIVPGALSKNRLLFKLNLKYNPRLFGLIAEKFLPWETW